ncbi:hypothetical protein PAXINDRAFT_168018 [Paxillus involutus ATCC 200175]|nr:hypothetical protein PAXINDRAFT_168018 [Paxillus involutus ATCC 200175]
MLCALPTSRATGDRYRSLSVRSLLCPLPRLRGNCDISLAYKAEGAASAVMQSTFPVR